MPLPIPKGSSISGLLSCFHPLLNLYSLAGYITLLVTKPVCPATSDTDKTGPLFQIPVGFSPDRQTTCLGSRHIFDYSICLSPEDLRYLPVPASAGRHALIALHLGVPLFNASLSKAVYHGLTGLSGCSGQNQSGPLAELETANRQLVGQLACFISLLSSDEIGAEEKGDKLKTLLRTNLPLKASMRLTGVYSNSKTWADVWMHRLATHCTGSGPGPWPLPVHSILLGDAGLQFLD
ncbi:unnamed protein product [Protopolystoma xenopodis]|uniref:Uncharacterized protein n=1 Tax=Protopolystoma xenopodis TaxID=117903 RepID=A0A448WWE0_9PLAT|nr:unnamed protein product [Protopolystoma xenopodis]